LYHSGSEEMEIGMEFYQSGTRAHQRARESLVYWLVTSIARRSQSLTP